MVHTQESAGYCILVVNALIQHQGGVGLLYRPSDHFHVEAHQVHAPNITSCQMALGGGRYCLLWGVNLPPTTTQLYSTLLQPSASTPMRPRCWWKETLTLIWTNHRYTHTTSKSRPTFWWWACRTCWVISYRDADHGRGMKGPGECFSREEKSDPGQATSCVQTSVCSGIYLSGI